MKDEKIEEKITSEKKFYLSLSEKDKRNYAACEALKIVINGRKSELAKYRVRPTTKTTVGES